MKRLRPIITRFTIDQLCEAVPGLRREHFPGNCHGVSLEIVRAGILPGASVARGFAQGVHSQHSWIATGNPYDRDALIIDPTLWTYRDDVDDVWYGTLRDGIHTPHGAGSIWRFGAPPEPVGEVIEIPEKAWEKAELSEREQESLRRFLNICGPLDQAGWSFLAHAPVEGWPARELYLVARHIPGLAFTSMVPIDMWAMVTGENTKELYR